MDRTPKVIRGLGNQIAEQLKREVWRGKYAPGDHVRERLIAEQYDVSRGPVRDALLQLTKEGLLVAEPNRGVRVRERVSPATRSLLVQVRRTIEAHSMRLGFPAPESDGVKRLCRNLAAFHEACKAGSLAEVVELDMAFHRQIVAMHPEDNLEPVWLPVVMQLSLPYSRHTDFLESYEEHKAVVEAVNEGDRRQALRALKQNIR